MEVTGGLTSDEEEGILGIHKLAFKKMTLYLACNEICSVKRLIKKCMITVSVFNHSANVCETCKRRIERCIIHLRKYVVITKRIMRAF